MMRLILSLFAAKNQKKLWVLVYVLACAATLIPTPLIEFRYYTIPFFFMVLHTDIIDNMSWLLLGFLYLCINFFTMYMFLFRPFSWAHEAGTQRFIWWCAHQKCLGSFATNVHTDMTFPNHSRCCCNHSRVSFIVYLRYITIQLLVEKQLLQLVIHLSSVNTVCRLILGVAYELTIIKSCF